MSDIELPKDLQSVLDSAAMSEPPAPDAKMVPLIDLIDLAEGDDSVNALYISGGDPNFVYAWLNTNAQMLEQNKMVYGYEIVTAGDTVKTLVPPNVLGERRVSDVVLARIAKSRYDRLMAKHIKKTKDALDGPNEKWLSEMRALGVSTVDNSRVAKKEGM